MTITGLLRALGVAAIIGAAPAASLAQGQPDGVLGLSLGFCPPGTSPLGVAQFRNVGKNDRNEGAPNSITISLCTTQPDIGLTFTSAYCDGQVVSRVRFQNVARTDFNEGAPNYVALSLCARGPVPGAFQLSVKGCPQGFVPISQVRFKNVGDKDHNEGAPSFVTVRLCAGG
ncbi:MAG: hypothetical protein OEQ29_15405 [Alphaproteobacteria bacterium]|nr:hypothetical protein [Alphaproteobacteria bacterium]